MQPDKKNIPSFKIFLFKFLFFNKINFQIHPITEKYEKYTIIFYKDIYLIQNKIKIGINLMKDLPIHTKIIFVTI